MNPRPAAKASRRQKCDCPLRCNYCGAKRRRDPVGHYCPTKNCQWQHGYSTCVKAESAKAVQP